MNTTRNILVVTYWDFNDALIQTYTLPYVKIISKYLEKGSKLFLVTIDKGDYPKASVADYENIINVSIRYRPFGFRALLLWFKKLFVLYRIIKTQKVVTIHCWCTPAGMIGYILSIITGAKLIIDSYEPHAESMVENGVWKKNSFAFKLLFKFEKLQTHRAQYLICANAKMKFYAEPKYNYFGNNFFTKPACVDLNEFTQSKIDKKKLIAKYGFEDKIICVYAGKFGGIYLQKEIFDFFKIAFDFWGDKFHVLVLSADLDSEVIRLAKESKLNHYIITKIFVPHSEVANYIGLANFAITPVKPVNTKKYCSPIKDGEYWALGLPVVITANISNDSEIIEENNIGAVIKEFKNEEYLRCVKVINKLITTYSKEQLLNMIRPIAEKHRSYVIAENVYKQIYFKE